MTHEKPSEYEVMMEEFGEDPRIVQTYAEVAARVPNPREFMSGLESSTAQAGNGEIVITEDQEIELPTAHSTTQ